MVYALFAFCSCGECKCVSGTTPRLVNLKCTTPLNPFLSPFQIREENRQDTVCGDKEFCLFKMYRLRGENRPLVALKGKAR